MGPDLGTRLSNTIGSRPDLFGAATASAGGADGYSSIMGKIHTPGYSFSRNGHPPQKRRQVSKSVILLSTNSSQTLSATLRSICVPYARGADEMFSAFIVLRTMPFYDCKSDGGNKDRFSNIIFDGSFRSGGSAPKKNISKGPNFSLFCALKFYTDGSAKNVIGFYIGVSVTFFALLFGKSLSTQTDQE